MFHFAARFVKYKGISGVIFTLILLLLYLEAKCAKLEATVKYSFIWTW